MPNDLISMKQLAKRCGISRSAAYKLRTTDPDFPRAVVLGPRLVRYKTSDADRYFDLRQQERLTRKCE